MNKKKIYTLSYSNILNPPPYLYKLDISFNFNEDGVHIKYNKVFLNREDFSEEELEDEGFSAYDNVELNDTLGTKWTTYFKELSTASNWSINKPSENIGNMVSLLFPDEDLPKYATINKIEYQLEEVYQAILENSKIEAPLSLHLKKVHNASEIPVELIWHFKDRTFEAIIKGKKTIKTWEEGQEVLTLFYETDLAELPVYKKKLPEGKICINPGDGLWYETPVSANWQKLMTRLFA